MNKTPRIDIPSLSSSASADGELNEDDIFAIDISHAPLHSPSSSPSQHPPIRQIQRSKSGLKNVEASGILAALPEPSKISYLSHVFHHKPASLLSSSVSPTASSSSSPGGVASAASSSSSRTIPTAPKPSQERLPFTTSCVGGGKYPQSAPVHVPLMPSAMMNRHKKEFKLTDVVDDEELENEEVQNVRNKHSPLIAYAYDCVYDVAAQHVVKGAMEGINGTILAYGKTHTMHGDQKSPGIIPLAVKDAFSIIQASPNREFLLRISYLEVYNEDVKDLLNPAGQNLRIINDKQGTFVEGIKEEVVLSPDQALSLIAAGEEQRLVGSTNFNLLTSRSHTRFTLTIESSPLSNKIKGGEAVHLSQLNLVDLAGSDAGLVKEPGENPYANSLVQMLYHIPSFGNLLSKVPGHVALKTVFYNLEHSRTSVSKTGLEMAGSSLQNEVLKLCEELELKLKGIFEVEGTIQKLFEGHFCRSKECKNTEDDKSSSVESFSCLDLDVKNCKDVHASFDKLVDEGIHFLDLPPVLQLHLPKVEYKNKTVKVNCNYEYPLVLDLDREERKYFSVDAVKTKTCNLYTLHSVICRDEGVLDGTHFALIRHKMWDLWLKFEDEDVSMVEIKKALDEQVGVVMLVYMRDCKEDVTKSLYASVKIITKEPKDSVSFLVEKSSKFQKFQEDVAECFGVADHRLRFHTSEPPSGLVWSRDQNQTVVSMLGDRDSIILFLRIDDSPGASGLCALCPGTPRDGRDFRLLDIEDF